jgi:hypothetical protein
MPEEDSYNPYLGMEVAALGSDNSSTPAEKAGKEKRGANPESENEIVNGDPSA